MLHKILMAILLILGVLIIGAIMMQPTKQNSAASAFMGGSDELFGRQKARGFEAVMQRATAIMGGAFLLVAFILEILASH
ncbi:MAG: preprotein translocase subunit SecG [Lactobacillales bacterium]|jgi:preprotein translocase subunit SecG|nr:preprotein translocase subunit SecG [Lactobacillales bacterium]